MTVTVFMLDLAEMLGTIAFALAGAMVALKKQLDIFGVLLLGMTTACGGGIIRDMMLGRVPPMAFQNYKFLIAAFLTSLIAFLFAYFGNCSFHREEEHIDYWTNVFDAVGLGTFAVAGVQAGIQTGFVENRVFLVFLGLMTGIGGGILRDLYVQQMPVILKRRIYALACIIGATLYVEMLRFGCDPIFASVVCCVLVFAIRMLATKYRWNLPRVE